MKKKKLLLTAIAVLLVLTLGISGTWAYFSTYVKAEGENPIKMGYETSLDEKVVDTTKTINVVSKKGSDPVYVRVKAYVADEYTKYMKVSYDKSLWTEKDGYYEYIPVLYSGETTKGAVTIKLEGMPEDINTDLINIVVTEESIPVFFEVKNGKATPIKPKAEDWSREYDVVKGGGK